MRLAANGRRRPTTCGARWPRRSRSAPNRSSACVLELARAGEDRDRRRRQRVASAEGEPGARLPSPLTRREREVLALLAEGRTNRQIADELFISESTAGVHVSNILGKLGVTGRTEAAAVAFRPA